MMVPDGTVTGGFGMDIANLSGLSGKQLMSMCNLIGFCFFASCLWCNIDIVLELNGHFASHSTLH